MKYLTKYTSVLFISLLLFVATISAQEIEFPAYTIQTTYEKLIEKYPFISPISEYSSAKIVKEENVVYLTINDQNLKADIYYPQSKESKFPAVILVHGGGWASGSKENQRPMAQKLAENGFLTMTVNYRLSTIAKYPASIEDLLKAIDFLLESNYPVNKEKISILGASAGAQMATLVGIKYNSNALNKLNKIKAILNIDGIVSFTHPESEEGKYASYWLNGSKEINLEIWEDASPLNFIQANSPPILFVNSSQPRFHAGRDDLLKKYKEFGIYTEVHTIKDSPHSFWLMNPWFEKTFEYVHEFLKKIFN